MKGDFNLELSTGGWDEKLTKLLDYLLSGYLRNIVVSPLAKYLSTKVSIGDSVLSVIKDYNIDKKQGYEALHELQNNVFVLLINENEFIDYYDDWIAEYLRYKVWPTL